jgi:hypothetical protein
LIGTGRASPTYLHVFDGNGRVGVAVAVADEMAEPPEHEPVIAEDGVGAPSIIAVGAMCGSPSRSAVLELVKMKSPSQPPSPRRGRQPLGRSSPGSCIRRK